jgi:hypothetical protein
MLFDIIQSYVIKGAIILIIIQAMISLQQTLYERSKKMQLEQELFQMSAILSSDLRRVGSDTVSIRPYFIIADTNQLQFKIGDSLSFAVTHIVNYSITKPGTFYELDRSVDGGTILPVGRNLTRFQCLFIDSVGNALSPTPLSDPNKLKIKSIAILAKMQTTTVTKDTVWSIWQAKIYPQNLPYF